MTKLKVQQFVTVELNFSTSVKTHLPSMSITLVGRGFLLAIAVACLSFLRCLSHVWRHGNVNDVEEF